jgi:hypothetical protein
VQCSLKRVVNRIDVGSLLQQEPEALLVSWRRRKESITVTTRERMNSAAWVGSLQHTLVLLLWRAIHNAVDGSSSILALVVDNL